VASTAAGDDSNLPARVPYPLRSNPESNLQLHSPLHTPRRGKPTNPPHLVSASINASTAMSGVEIDPEALSDSDNLTRILAQLTTMNTQLDSHEQRLAHLEKTVTELSANPTGVHSGGVANSGGAVHSGGGSGGDLGAEDGGSLAQGGTLHLGGGGTASAGRRGQGGGGLGGFGSGGSGLGGFDGGGGGRGRFGHERFDDSSARCPNDSSQCS
jgi:hypothetical protein